MKTSLNAVTAAAITPVPLRWLWRDRLPLGKLCVIAGPPGLGKSVLAVNIAAAISSGRPFGDEQPSIPGNVLMVSAEDDAGDTLRPRLEEAGADLDCVYIEQGVIRTDAKGRTSQHAFVDLSDVGTIERAVRDIGDVRLVVLDPISAYFGRTDAHSTSEVRALLQPLSAMAQRYACSVVLIAHLNKSSGGSALNRVNGAVGLVAAARVAHCVVRDPEDSERRLFLPLKSNLGPDRGGLAYRIIAPRGVPILQWEVGCVAVTADQVMAQSDGGGGGVRSDLDDAKQFLNELLKDGPCESKDVQREARSAGISEATLRRAKEALKVVAAKAFGSGRWRWRLPDGQGAQGDHDDHVDQDATEGPEQGAQDDQGAQGDHGFPVSTLVDPAVSGQADQQEPPEQHDHVARLEQDEPTEEKLTTRRAKKSVTARKGAKE